MLAGSVWNDNAVIGTNAVGTPIHRSIFGKITLSIDDAVFICVSIKTDTAIIKSPIVASSLASTNLEISPTTISPIRQIIALGNIVRPDIEGLYPRRLCTNIGTKSSVEYNITFINELASVPNIKFLSLNTLMSITGYLYSSSQT